MGTGKDKLIFRFVFGGICLLIDRDLPSSFVFILNCLKSDLQLSSGRCVLAARMLLAIRFVGVCVV